MEHRPTSAIDEGSATRPLWARAALQRMPQWPFERLLLAATPLAPDGKLPPQVRVIIGTGVEVYVVTPRLPERLAWLADDVHRFRRTTDERVDTGLAADAFVQG